MFVCFLLFIQQLLSTYYVAITVLGVLTTSVSKTDGDAYFQVDNNL